MNHEEYTAKRDEIERKARKEKGLLAYACAKENNSVKKGDMVTDTEWTIKVDSMRLYAPGFGDVPYCVYKGFCYTKRGKPYKNGRMEEVQQCNMIRHMPKED